MKFKRWILLLLCGLMLLFTYGCQIQEDPVRVEIQIEPETQPAGNQDIGSQQREDGSFLDTLQDVAQEMLPEWDSLLDTEGPGQQEEAAPAMAAVPDIDSEKPIIALTFDDGPGGESTERILDVLEQYQIRATFFVQGKQVAQHPDTVKRAVELGCQIGNHTYNHKDLTSLSNQEALEQLESVNELVREQTGAGCALVRPPHGRGWKDERILGLVPYPLIMWSIDTRDWSTRDPEQTIQSVLDEVQDGDIVLLHDVYNETADAVEAFVPKLVEQGYQLVTVSEMFAAKGKELTPGHAYRNAR